MILRLKRFIILNGMNYEQEASLKKKQTQINKVKKTYSPSSCRTRGEIYTLIHV